MIRGRVKGLGRLRRLGAGLKTGIEQAVDRAGRLAHHDVEITVKDAFINTPSEWPKLSGPYAARKARAGRGGDPILYFTGELYRGIVSDYDPATRVIYCGVPPRQTELAKIARAHEKGLGNVPERSFLRRGLALALPDVIRVLRRELAKVVQ